jgi:Arc/MetJ-type ribon-helix-helix transcriptional regulator
MSTIQVDIPEVLAREVRHAVQAGWFGSEEEVVLDAARQFMQRQRLELSEEYQLRDIEWAAGLQPTK